MDATSNCSGRLRRSYRYGKSLCLVALSEVGKMWLGHLSLIEWLTCTFDKMLMANSAMIWGQMSIFGMAQVGYPTLSCDRCRHVIICATAFGDCLREPAAAQLSTHISLQNMHAKCALTAELAC